MNEKLQNVLLLLLWLATVAWTTHHNREADAKREEQRKARQTERARHFPPATPTQPIMINAN